VRSPTGRITPFDVPGAVKTVARAINNNGVVSGWFVDPEGVYHGFLRDPLGALTTFDAPGAGTNAGQGTMDALINSNGRVTGYFVDNTGGPSHGFVRNPAGSTATFDAPEAGTHVGQGTVALSVNAVGAVMGLYIDSANVPHSAGSKGLVRHNRRTGSWRWPGPGHCRLEHQFEREHRRPLDGFQRSQPRLCA
jgi:hypothetical protein